MLKLTRHSFTQNLAKGKLLIPYLEQFKDWDVPWEFKYEPKVDDDAWHPSGDCLPSATELYEKALDSQHYSPSHSPSLQRSFGVGHYWHQLLQRVILQLGFAKSWDIERRAARMWGEPLATYDKSELYFDHVEDLQPIEAHPEVAAWPSTPSGLSKMRPVPYHWVVGSGDIAPLTLPSGWEGICDIKTMNSRDFKDAQRSGLLPERFADKYEAQINIYMALFGFDDALILGVNKDAPHDFLEFPFERNQHLIDTILNKWEYVSECLDNETPPDEEKEFPLVFQGPTG